MNKLLKIGFILILVISISAFLSNTGSGQVACDPGVPHIEIYDHPNDPVTHNEGQYFFEKVYGPDFPEHYVYEMLHCGVNKMKFVDPCNPWVLEWYVGFYDDETDQVKVSKPLINWDTVTCQDINFEVIYPNNFDYTYNTYYDSVVMKVTMTPHPVDNCIDPLVPYVCYNGDTIYNYSCWNSTCIGELITFQCVDSCAFPNTATCLMNFDKPLPVELNSFTATADNGNVILSWTTSMEMNNTGFDIERKTESVWGKIGFIEGKGNSDVLSDYTFIDKKLNPGSYNYRLKQIDFNGNFEYYDLSGFVNIGVPNTFKLSQNYPNPFNPSTRIDFALPNNSNVILKIYDLTGKEVETVLNDFRTAGYYTVNFNASNLASGIYYYKLTAGNDIAVNKMVVVK
ncbi:MAG TPA: T9SS type A sorting domain-containing protein [Ignavibacteria bacterium]|nr:hypothetical protein [Bacteroidota bacterium]HRI84228.1 T9SS type A sorting domain-containing protein [Ignavibacteria bacterium]HRJ99042.1 T9SS type A sorting domain-containing protein [Ignavibacteria bacterium]